MSKAFTSEEVPDEPLVVVPRPSLPPGVPNYVTPRGMAALREERRRLLEARAAASPSDDLAYAARVDAQLHALDERIASGVVVTPSAHAGGAIRFGARVTVRAVQGDRTYEIVGVDEADASAGRIAFVAPLARALLGKSAGDLVTVRTPRGGEDLEILDVAVDSLEAGRR